MSLGRSPLVAVPLWLAIVSSLAAEGPIVLRDVTGETGIAFRHTDGSSGGRYIVETVASGLATFDCDGDGRIDIYFVNGAPLRGAPGLQASSEPDHHSAPPRNALYRNLGGFRFEDVTAKAGVGDTGYGLGVCVGDYDNDGRPDLYVSNYGPNVLYHNNGDGTFADVTARAGVARGDTVGAGVNFLDIDGDGNLDLFVSNYVAFTYENHVTRTVVGHPRYPSPKDFPHQPDRLFRGNGEGTFADVSRESGIAAHPGPGMGTVCLDFDNDGDTDIFVCNDTTGNFLFQNDGRGRFEEVGLTAGVAYNVYGDAMGSMGADAGDYDHDGWLDLFKTDYQGEMPVLFRNRGGVFEDVAQPAGAGRAAVAMVKWGCGMADFDNDGHKDILFVCGHLDDNVAQWDGTTSYLARPVLLRNLGNGRFDDVSNSSGDGLQVRCVGRGLALDDLDNDGRIDAVILNSRRPPTVLRNQSPAGHHWLQVRLQGVKTNRDGVGARVKVVAGDLVQYDEVHSGRGYQSHFGSRLHFGLGSRGRVDRVEVRWIGGGSEVFEGLTADRLVVLTEGTGNRRSR